ncbi:hypothetical protein JX266_013146 [Neoarthrinium moseri]|nr:hypothetical protein JX266_013146 [Neoarthrinium moseri]
MLFSAVLVGLLAEVVASAAYSVPVEMIAEADCTLPAQYTIGDFTTFGDKFNGTSNTTTFHFTDSATGIDTSCQRNSSSKSITPGRGSTPRWPCDNSNVEFIYQANGLTVIEAACPESTTSTKFEAAGTTAFNLTCTNKYDGTFCTSALSTVTNNFTSFEPRTAA